MVDQYQLEFDSDQRERATGGARMLDAIEGLGRVGDLKLVAAAQAALRENRQPTLNQLRAWKRHAYQMETDERRALLGGVTHRLLREMAGDRSSQVINEMQDRYGIPTRGAIVSMHDIIKGFFDWFAANGRKIDRLGDEGVGEQAVTRLRVAKAEREEVALQRDRQSWIPRESISDGMTVMSGIIRKGAERLQNEFGQQAYQILDEALVDAEEALRRRFEGVGESSGGHTGEAIL